MEHYRSPHYDDPQYDPDYPCYDPSDYPCYDSDDHPDSGGYWYQDENWYTDEVDEYGIESASEDVNPDGFAEDPRDLSSGTSFFENSSNFIINGGTFSNIGGNIRAQFGSRSEAPSLPPNSSRQGHIFQGASDFVIEDDDPDAPQKGAYTRSRPSKRNRRQQEHANVSRDQDPSQDPGRRRSSKQKKRVRSHASTVPGPEVPMPVPGTNVPMPSPGSNVSMSMPVPSDMYTSDYSRAGMGAAFPTPDPHWSPVYIPEPVNSLPIPSQTPAHPAFFVRRDNGNNHPMPQRRFQQTPESQQQSEYETQRTLATELKSTTRKLKKLALGAKRSSKSGTQMVGLDDHSSRVSMPTPQGTDLRADWRSPSPSVVPTPRSEMSTAPTFLRSRRVRLGVPLPPPLDMPQPSTSKVTFPTPHQG